MSTLTLKGWWNSRNSWEVSYKMSTKVKILIGIVLIGVLAWWGWGKTQLFVLVKSLPDSSSGSVSEIKDKHCPSAGAGVLPGGVYECNYNIYQVAPTVIGGCPSYVDARGYTIATCCGGVVANADDPWQCRPLSRIECSSENLCE